MTTLTQLRKAALGLPAVEEGSHSGMVAFSVRGKDFASVDKDGVLKLHLPQEVADSAVAAYPTGERLVRMGSPIGFRVALAEIDGKGLNALVHEAWRFRAPAPLVKQHMAIAQTSAGTDLPAAVGKPATRALLGAGISSLAQVAEHSRAELLALHGVGPKAVRILTEQLAQQGKSLR